MPWDLWHCDPEAHGGGIKWYMSRNEWGKCVSTAEGAPPIPGLAVYDSREECCEKEGWDDSCNSAALALE
jgi:hypothetical protein